MSKVKETSVKQDIKSMLKSVKMEKISGGESFSFKKPGDKLVGVLRGTKKGEYDGKEITIYNIEDCNNKVWGVWESKALEVLSDLPKGAIVSIEFLAKKKGKKGRTFKDFEILSDSVAEIK